MELSAKTIRKILIGVFTILSFIELISTFYIVLMTAFGVGWGGGETTTLEIIWMWKGFVFLTILSILATIGLIRENKSGLLFGFVIALSLLIYFVIMFVAGLFMEIETNLTDIIISIGYISVAFILLLGLSKLKKTFEPILKKDYLIGIILISILLLSFVTLFV